MAQSPVDAALGALLVLVAALVLAVAAFALVIANDVAARAIRRRRERRDWQAWLALELRGERCPPPPEGTHLEWRDTP